jgi:hypothetical protein
MQSGYGCRHIGYPGSQLAFAVRRKTGIPIRARLYRLRKKLRPLGAHTLQHCDNCIRTVEGFCARVANMSFFAASQAVGKAEKNPAPAERKITAQPRTTKGTATIFPRGCTIEDLHRTAHLCIKVAILCIYKISSSFTLTSIPTPFKIRTPPLMLPQLATLRLRNRSRFLCRHRKLQHHLRGCATELPGCPKSKVQANRLTRKNQKEIRRISQ